MSQQAESKHIEEHVQSLFVPPFSTIEKHEKFQKCVMFHSWTHTHMTQYQRK